MKNKLLWYRRLAGCMPTVTPTEYVVLTMLANYADRNGRRARPAAATLARDCSVSDKTVRRALAALVSKGYLVVDQPGKGRGRATVYSLVWDMPHTDEKTGHDDDQLTDPGNLDTHDVQVSEPENWTSDALKLDTQGPKTGQMATENWTPRMSNDQREQGKEQEPHHARARTHTRVPARTREPDEPPAPEPDLTPNPRIKSPAHRRQSVALQRGAWHSHTAFQIVQQFITTLAGALDRTTRNEITTAVDELLGDGIPAEQIAAGLTAWQQSDSWSPTQIRRFVVKAAAPRQRTRPSTTDQRMAEGLALAAKYADQDDPAPTQAALDAARYL